MQRPILLNVSLLQRRQLLHRLLPKPRLAALLAIQQLRLNAIPHLPHLLQPGVIHRQQRLRRREIRGQRPQIAGQFPQGLNLIQRLQAPLAVPYLLGAKAKILQLAGAAIALQRLQKCLTIRQSPPKLVLLWGAQQRLAPKGQTILQLLLGHHQPVHRRRYPTLKLLNGFHLALGHQLG